MPSDRCSPFSAPVRKAALMPLNMPSPIGAVTALVTPNRFAYRRCLPPNSSPSTARGVVALSRPNLPSPDSSGSKTSPSTVDASEMMPARPSAGPKPMKPGAMVPLSREILAKEGDEVENAAQSSTQTILPLDTPTDAAGSPLICSP